MIFKASDN